MSQIHSEASAVIDAQPEKIYGVFSDYHVGHPAILPKPYFTGLIIEQGGQGAGTIVRVEMNVMGARRAYRLSVTEPEPGRLLMETDPDAGVVTTFTVDPINGGQQSRVTIATDAKASPGIQGFFEKLITPPISRRIYNKELELLAAYVKE
jgi:hypothetical protein